MDDSTVIRELKGGLLQVNSILKMQDTGDSAYEIVCLTKRAISLIMLYDGPLPENLVHESLCILYDVRGRWQEYHAAYNPDTHRGGNPLDHLAEPVIGAIHTFLEPLS